MADKEKAVAVVGGLGLAGLIGYLLTRKVKAVPPPGEGAASVTIQVYDAEGRLVPADSPVTLDEGGDYTLVAIVTNATTRAGEPWEATLTIELFAGANAGIFTNPAFTEVFAPNETRSYPAPFHIPVGWGGMTGGLSAGVYDPAGKLLAEAVEPLTIRALAIIYGATVTIGV